MKIAFLHFWTLRMRRGVETLIISLANELAAQGVDVSVITARQTQPPLVSPHPAVRVQQFPTFRYHQFATMVPFYAADLLRHRYDVVITFFADFGEGPALRLVSRFTQPRLFLYLTFPYEAAPHRYRAYRRWGWDADADCILADAAYTAREGERLLGRKVELLPSGTDPERFRPDPRARSELRQRFGFGDQDVVLLNVAALQERKGVWRMIEALPDIQRRCPNIRYLILGEGPQRAELQRRVDQLKLGEHVIFAGTTADLPPYYNAADVFVLVSEGEAGSVACLEAMASGLPVIVSDAGGFSEVVNIDNARMVALGDHAGLVHAVVELAGCSTLRHSLGMAGREVIRERFSWARIAEQLQRML